MALYSDLIEWVYYSTINLYNKKAISIQLKLHSYFGVFTPFINKYKMVENSPIARGNIIIGETIALYSGNNNETVLSIK